MINNVAREKIAIAQPVVHEDSYDMYVKVKQS